MAGLKPTAASPEAQAAPPQKRGLMPRDEPQDSEQPNVTPEEQAEYESYVKNALRLVFDDATLPTVVEKLRAGDPVLALAETGALIAQRLYQSAEQQGVSISGDVQFHGGKAIIENLADVMDAAGIADLSDDQIGEAFLQAADLYRAALGDKAQPDLQREALGEIAQAAGEGRLDEILPGGQEALEGALQGGQA